MGVYKFQAAFMDAIIAMAVGTVHEERTTLNVWTQFSEHVIYIHTRVIYYCEGNNGALIRTSN
jgi:hypothetical protein